jgi:redox-sensitive bicupin YhaK (pirin superfamily)
MHSFLNRKATPMENRQTASASDRAVLPEHRALMTLRKITDRTKGRRHGPITRLMSPGDLGEVLKPFVFLDLIDMSQATFPGFGLHPHSGIATLTYLFEGNVQYEDTSGATGVLPAGGVEWFKAGLGAWHGGSPGDAPRTRGFQLWIALPPDQEGAPVESVYQSPDGIRQAGPARVLLGSYGGMTSPLKPPSAINYLAVRLKAGESWRYEPPAGHTLAFVALAKGRLNTPDPVEMGELAIFEPSNDPIEFDADADSEFVIGSAAPHPHPLVLGSHSVHTSKEALTASLRRIREIEKGLREEGRL